MKVLEQKILFFDGVCGLCDHFISFLVVADTKNILQFAPQQGETFQLPEIQRIMKPEVGESLFYLRNGKIYEKSTAVINALCDLGGAWKLIGIFKVIPRPLRDLIYDLGARNRYKIFGKHENCRLPTPEERAKFLT